MVSARIPRPLRLAATAFVLSLVLSGAAGASGHAPRSGGFYSTETPYAPRHGARRHERPPRGFTPVFTQLVARHGSRALTSSHDLEYTKQLIGFARADGGLTELGARLEPEVLELQAAIEALGYGNLSGRGAREHRLLAARLAERMRRVFEDAAAAGRHVRVVTSGKDRAVDSASNFAASLGTALPQLAPLIDPPVVNADLLYFFKQPQNADYQDWLAHDPTLAATLAAITYGERSHENARRLLEPLFRPAVVDKLAAAGYVFHDPKTGAAVSRNEVDAALSLYEIYRVGPGLVDEVVTHFEEFVDARAARWFEYVSDATEFYGKGPSFAGSTITFRMAKVLQDDFFAAVEALRDAHAEPVAATLRFAHAETLMPFAALMKLPWSDVQAAELYTRRSNPWRGSLVSPYAVNVQWDVYRGRRGELLVKMLYDERETRFKRDCRSIRRGSSYYAFDELKRCYGYR